MAVATGRVAASPSNGMEPIEAITSLLSRLRALARAHPRPGQAARPAMAPPLDRFADGAERGLTPFRSGPV